MDKPQHEGKNEALPKDRPEHKPLDWEGLFQRYVWDSERTPYGVAVAKLNRRQADYELLAFCLFMGVLFAVVAFVALSGKGPFGRAPAVSLYAFTVVCGAAILGLIKSPPAAWYLSLAPLFGLVFAIGQGLSGGRAWVDTVLAVGVLLVLLLYSVRVIAIARAYAAMPEATTPPTGRRRRRSMF